MPATVPTAFGSLVAPEITKGPDIADALMSGMQFTAGIAAKRQALENQYAELVVRQQEAAANRALRMQEFGITKGLREKELALDQQRLTQAGNQWNADYELRKSALGLSELKDVGRTEAVKGLIQIESDLINEGYVAGQPGYSSEALRRVNAAGIAGRIPASEFNAWMKRLFENQNTGQNQQRQIYETLNRDWYQRARGITSSGTLNLDLDPILHPYDQPDAPPQKTGGWFGIGAQEVPVEPGKEKKLIHSFDAGGNPKDKTVLLSDLLQLNKERQMLDEQAKNLTSFETHPNLGVYPPAPRQYDPGKIYYVANPVTGRTRAVRVKGFNPQTGKPVVEDVPGAPPSSPLQQGQGQNVPPPFLQAPPAGPSATPFSSGGPIPNPTPTATPPPPMMTPGPMASHPQPYPTPPVPGM
jgi:hypothetical protein